MKSNNILGFVSIVLVVGVLMPGLSGRVSASDYDLVQDGSIDWRDLDAFTDEWLGDCNVFNNWCNGTNFNDDNNNIDFDDFGLFARHWFIDPNLVGWWKFEEGSGDTARDSSGNNNDGILYGEPNWVAGEIGSYALDFNGTDDHVEIANDDSLNITDEITIGVWAKPAAYSGQLNSMVQKWGNVSNRRQYLLTVMNGKVRWYISTDGANYPGVIGVKDIPTDEWSHIVGMYDNSKLKIYVNGSLDNEVSQSGSIFSSDVIARIGGYGPDSETPQNRHFDGVIDDARIYNRALSEAKVRVLAGVGGQAWNPDPSDGASYVDGDAVLSWSAAEDALSHDVYFGTNFDDVNDANNSWPVATGPDDPNVYKGNQAGTTYDPCGLEVNTTYYWRIDEVTDTDIFKGDVWRFDVNTPAFPTAEGPGRCTKGGRGGQIIKVTNLLNSGAGSLRAAVQASGPRTVVFDVSGTITLLSRLDIENDYITIAGQTAPGDGITLKDYGLRVDYADDVIVRYIRVRPADNVATEPDSIAVYHGNKVMLDHCSASWSVDETLSVTHSDKTTIQWCMISESLNYSTHSDTPHGYASLIVGDLGKEVTYHHNLYAHHKTRCPRPQNTNISDTVGWFWDFRNNVIYSWLDTNPGYNSDDPPRITLNNFIGNYYKNRPGDNTTQIFYENGCTTNKGYFSNNSLDDNIPGDPWSLVRFSGFTSEQITAYKQSEPFDVIPVATDSPSTAYTRVMADVGACLPARDPVDVRILGDVQNGTGNIIDDEDEVGGWPTLYSLTAPTDNDSDGMPNYWEEQYSGILDPNSGSDHSGDADSDGYTNIEEYLNNTDPNGGDDMIVYIAASISRAYEETETAGEFTVYRTGDTGSPLTVNYSVSGTATGGSDYTTLSGSVTIAGGNSSATIDVTPINDGSPDNAEQVIVSIDPHSSYKLGLPRKALVVILDED